MKNILTIIAGVTLCNLTVAFAGAPIPPPSTMPPTQQPASSAPADPQKRPFTVTALIRGEYDDNINTSNSNEQSSWKLIGEPSIIYNKKDDNTSYAARYTLSAAYYFDRPGNKDVDLSHEIYGRIKHQFSDRVGIDVRDRLRITQEPAILDAPGSVFIRTNNDYIFNAFDADLMIQWTPKFGTISGYGNDVWDYEDKGISRFEDRMVHKGKHEFRFLVVPTTTLVVGGLIGYHDYWNVRRDFVNYTGMAGVDHDLTRQATIGLRAGITHTDFIDGGSYNSPYGQVLLNIETGANSSINASYSHTIASTSLNTYYAREADTFTLGGRYQWTPKFSTRVQGMATFGEHKRQFVLGLPTITKIRENIYGVDVGMNYEVNKNLELEAGYIYTTVDSNIQFNEYDRNRVYFGVRGTY
ncbi:MAG: outer membrane beta-barrel protein [Methylacidiphilales bacterium]|nr:outer membrane beta-barrel protein [Candidatus Methylacidiphilales bacterium]MDW8349258.1 outer membrane beta-barrel protein [Verrucomicrobiae bacterium]